MQGIAKTLAIELGSFGINVNSVALGFIESEITRGIAEKTGIPFVQIKDNYIKANAIKRVGRPENIANTVVFLVNDESEYITEQVIYVADKPVN